FNSWDRDSLDTYRKQDGLAMTLADLEHVQRYFRDQEKRDPRETELKVLDTYWSDHCRHTTFETKIESLEIEHGPWKESIHNAWLEYQQVREDLNRQKKPSTLMDLATLAAKEMRSKGELDDLEISEEINACSVKIDVTVDDKKEPWLLMFKNETHNHPTEIEPFGGASTCIGGAIRDPLSGRSYVYQAMRVTGSGDPRAELEDTIPGKLPQKVITRGAARGYSSYGNQIGLATSLVKEIYHPGYQAKRMEVGAVVGAVPQDWVRRESPVPGDIVLLLGGKTGRDGCGGATGSSKAHTEDSLMSCGAEVQKGNAPEERKIQRLFRNPELTKLIKKCNDFGAGGVSVAIGELSDGLTIDLDQVPVKYLGLNGTELAISESQERMAVVVEPQHVSNFILLAKKENLECLKVAEVTGENRLTMTWKGQTLVDLDRTFLDTNGVRSSIDVKILSPQENENPFLRNISGKDRSEQFINNLKELNVASQKGLGEMFDASIGKGTVFMPYGGKNQLSESEASAHKLPVLHGETQTCSIMGHGYNPEISSWSPYHGSLYAVVESITRLAAMGGDWQKSRLSFQEYFQRMTSKEIWGQPLAALLGALQIQRQWKAPAIGGKDSMSGSFGDIHVPPTLISFAVCTGEADKLTSSEFQQDGSYLYLLRHTPKEDLTPDSAQLQDNFNYLDQLRSKGNVLSAMSIKEGGVAEVLFKAAVGNGLGVEANLEDWAFNREFGSILFESSKKLEDSRLIFIGRTNGSGTFIINGKSLTRKNALKNWKEPLAKVFHDLKDQKEELLEQIIQEHKAPH
ncbi:MAG: phosphoribosylformylglycinamidine synthase, partial [Spirochaetaceae bacterium]|nr:phosphoribosylformylglycinamidine synthase [Spirochaetaceae bacterium]